MRPDVFAKIPDCVFRGQVLRVNDMAFCHGQGTKLVTSECWAKKNLRRCRGSNPGHPRDRREYLPLYYNDLMVFTHKNF
jgi:hypothetical protein